MDSFISVRAVKVPKQEIDNVEQQFGAKLVPDSEYHVLLNLDHTLRKYRLEHDKDPDVILLMDDPAHFYKHMVLNINFMGMEIPGSYNKPAWFRFKRSF